MTHFGNEPGRLCTWAALAVFAIHLAVAQPAGTFVQAGGTTFSRAGHTATLLRDGRVLIAGDSVGVLDSAVSLDSAEIFDPSTGTFTLTGKMKSPRSSHTAALLEDGRVLLAGGWVFDGAFSTQASMTTSAEIYDPVKGAFELAGDLPIAYDLAIASAVLKDGRVLLVGGGDRPGAGGSMAIYDPGVGKFSTAGVIPLTWPSATPLPNGKVLLVGVNSAWSDNAAAIYDPATGTSNPMSIGASNSLLPDESACCQNPRFASAALANGDVLILGRHNAAAIYAFAEGVFQGTGSLAGQTQRPTVVTLPGGRLLAGGDRTSALFDPASGTFSSVNIPSAMGVYGVGIWGTSTTLLTDGTVLILGAGPSQADAWLYSPAPSTVSSATLAAPMAPASLASIFGSRLTGATAAAANAQSPPANLDGTNIRVRDSAGTELLAPLLYVSPSQINFEIPEDVIPGTVTLEVLSGSNILSITAQVKTIAPGIFTLPGNIAAAYATRIELDGSQTTLAPGAPIELDPRPVYLSLFGTGLRGVSSLDSVRVDIAGLDAPVVYAGPQLGIPGLDQVNVLVPAALKGAGLATLLLTTDGIAANKVFVKID